MGTTNIGNQTTGRLSCFCECLDVTRMTGAHFDDGYLVLLRQTEQCLGHTNIVVEVALRIEDIVFL